MTIEAAAIAADRAEQLADAGGAGLERVDDARQLHAEQHEEGHLERRR